MMLQNWQFLDPTLNMNKYHKVCLIKQPIGIGDVFYLQKFAHIFKESGYDRGHLCPAGDRRFSENAYNETFYTSNISPQDKDFNAGIWNRLEQQVRYWAKKDGPLFVVTAGVLEEGLPGIGEEDVAVPKFYYKIIAKGKGKNLRIIAFLLPHRENIGSLDKFVVSVDKLEKMTGINFFPNLPDDQEDILEADINTSGWKF